jgi:hypothetical protein
MNAVRLLRVLKVACFTTHVVQLYFLLAGVYVESWVFGRHKAWQRLKLITYTFILICIMPASIPLATALSIE